HGFLVAVVALVTHSLVYWMTQVGGKATLLFVPLMAASGLVTALAAWLYFFRRATVTPDERIVATFYAYFVVTAYAIYATAFPFRREDLLAVYPVVSLVTGLYYLLIGRLYWGPLYAHAGYFFLLAFALKAWPDEAPLVFAVGSAAHSVTCAILMRL